MKSSIRYSGLLQTAIAASFTIFSTLQPATAAQTKTALDEYVTAPDSAYQYELIRSIPGKGFKGHILDMTSQRWLTKKEVDRTLWQHWIRIIEPDQVEHDTALLFIGGGANGREAPKTIDEQLAKVAMATKSVVAELGMVPNQPLIFHGDGVKRTEDNLIAYGWDQYLRTGEPKWLARLPMTKSAVRAMDTISDFLSTDQPDASKVNQYVVAGGSKRGWTTWTTGAVDSRVKAIIPIVIDLLNVVPSFKHHYRAYGFFAPAVGDYEAAGIMDWQETQAYQNLLKIVEPYEYRERFTMPKLLLNATGDQFFVPDSLQFYWNELPGPKHVRYVPNSEHSMRETDAMDSLIAYYQGILNETPLPEFTWKINKSNAIIVTPQDKPAKALLWQAHNPEARDFRVDTIGRSWKSRELKLTKKGRFIGKIKQPENGFSAYFVELIYSTGAPTPFKATTQVKVIPDKYPFDAYQPKSIKR